MSFFYNKMHIFDHWLTKPTNLSIWFRLFHIIYLSIINKSMGKLFLKNIFTSIDHSIFQSTFVGLLLRISFGVLFSIETLFIVDLFFHIGLIRTFYPKTCPWVFWQIFCGLYTNQTYGFSPPTVLRKILERVLVGCSFFFK